MKEKIERQVSNLELSKKLKDLNVKQESLYKWRIYKQSRNIKLVSENIYDCLPMWYDEYAAFSVGELELPLGWTIIKESDGYGLYTEDKEFHDYYSIDEYPNETEANSHAKAKIWLIETGKMKV